MDITSLGRKAHKGKQADNFGMKRPSNTTDINKGQEAPRINLNLQTKVARHMSNKVKPKKEVGDKQQNKLKDLKEAYKIDKENLLEMKQPPWSHAHAEGP